MVILPFRRYVIFLPFLARQEHLIFRILNHHCVPKICMQFSSILRTVQFSASYKAMLLMLQLRTSSFYFSRLCRCNEFLIFENSFYISSVCFNFMCICLIISYLSIEITEMFSISNCLLSIIIIIIIGVNLEFVIKNNTLPVQIMSAQVIGILLDNL